jgi:hypothetical protein
MVTLPPHATMQLSACCPGLRNMPRSSLTRLFCCAGTKRVASGEKMKLLDICVIGLVSIVCLSRLPSPLRSLKSDLIAKRRLTALSAVCDLLVLLIACDYVASRFSPVGQKYPGWIAAEIVCLVASGLLLGPAFRAFLSRLFAKSPSRTQPVKAALSPR